MLNQAAPLPSKIKLEKGGKLSIIIDEKRNRYYLSFGNILKEELIGFHNEPYWVAFGLSIYPILTGNGKKKFKSKGFTIKKHASGQFTELYAKFSFGLIRKFIHHFNYLWFKYVRIPHLAFGNIIILEKQI